MTPKAGRTCRDWPTHRGRKEFWEELGRTVAALGMLEDTLSRALSVVRFAKALGVVWLPDAGPANREVEERLMVWKDKVEKDLSGSLGTLGRKVEAALRELHGEVPDAYNPMIEEAKGLAEERNLLCHGAWVGFEEPNVGTVRYFERGNELAGDHRQQRSLWSIKATRERAAEITKAMISEVERTHGITFPGKTVRVERPK